MNVGNELTEAILEQNAGIGALDSVNSLRDVYLKLALLTTDDLMSIQNLFRECFTELESFQKSLAMAINESYSLMVKRLKEELD